MLKCRPLGRIHARRRLRHSFIASLMTLCFKPRARHTCSIHCFSSSIDVMNVRVVEPLLHFSTNSVLNRSQIWFVGSHMSGEMKAGVSHSRRPIVSRARCARALSCWKLKNSPEISHMTGSSCSARHHSMWRAVNLYLGKD